MCAGREREKSFRPLPHYALAGCAQHMYSCIRFLTICIHGHASHGAAWHIPWMHEYATPISTSRVSMAEIRGVEEGLPSSVFGERHVGSPNREVKGSVDGCASSVFGDRPVCSPMTEVKRPIDGNLSSVFGERQVASPIVEVKGVVEGFLSSVFGERLVVSPKTEVKKPIDGNLSSVFGDGCVIRRTRKFGVWRTCLYPPYSATYSHALLLVRSYPYAFYSRDPIRDLPPQSSSITSIRNLLHNLHPQTFSRTSYPRNLYPHG